MDTAGGATVQEQLVELERRLLRPGPTFDVAALIADDFVEIGASGRRWDRASVLDLVDARRDEGVGDYEIDEVACRGLGGDAYLLTYATRTDQGLTRRASIWDVIGTRWQMIYHQGTRVPG